MALGPDDVRHVARLARIALDDEEVERFRAELGAILEAMRAIDEIDLEGVEPTFSPLPIVSRLRPDEEEPSLDREEVLKAAPKSDEGGFAVPRVLEGH